MSVRKINLDWCMAVDDDDWLRLQQTSPSDPTPDKTPKQLTPTRRLWRAGITGMVVALLIAGGTWVWQTAHRGIRQVEHEVGEGVQLEMGTLAVLDEEMAQQANVTAEDEQLREILHVAMLNDFSQFETELLAVEGDHAAVRIFIQENGETLRQVRFYHRMSTGWQPMPPTSSLWGPTRELETDYFVFWFQQQDGRAVGETAARLDALYATMLHNFGLPEPATKRVISVSLLQNPRADNMRLVDDSTWVVASPARYLAPVEISDGDLLTQAIVLALLDETIAQAKAHYGVTWRWQSLYEGLYLWQLWSLDVPLAVWHDELITWYFSDASSEEAGWPFDYGELCSEHTLWMQGLTQIHILFLCTERENYVICCYPRRISPILPEGKALDLFEEPYCMRNCSLELEQHMSNWPYCAGESIALATVFEYAVAAYGPDHLPALLASMGRDESWDVVVANSFGVTTAQFEQGWQEYIRAHYLELAE